MLFEKFVVNMYKKELLVRHDDDGTVFQFSHQDFDGLSMDEFAFFGESGQRLQGYFYKYEVKYEGRVVIFDHGMGRGHRAYMKEIELLARAGYLAFTYDHTGCMRSEGENIRGFAQSLSDLDYAIRALKKDERYSQLDISVVGHSWGAFSTLNISAIYPDISHIVALSGFVSVEKMLSQLFAKMKGYIPAILRCERAAVPNYADYNAIDSLSRSKAKALIIHSTDDATVSFTEHFAVMREALAGRENTEFIELTGKGHNPNFTEDAVKYKDAYFLDLTKRRKKKKLRTTEERAAFLKSYDFDRMTKQDEELWAKIFAFLER